MFSPTVRWAESNGCRGEQKVREGWEGERRRERRRRKEHSTIFCELRHDLACHRRRDQLQLSNRGEVHDELVVELVFGVYADSTH
jgi:hypothetical protein